MELYFQDGGHDDIAAVSSGWTAVSAARPPATEGLALCGLQAAYSCWSMVHL